MNSMGKKWVLMGNIKPKDWYIVGDSPDSIAIAYLQHKLCTKEYDVDTLSLLEILDVIADHECP